MGPDTTQIPGEIAGSLHDCDELGREELALLLGSFCPDPAAILDADGRVVSGNEAFLTLVGRDSSAAAFGFPWDAVLHPEDRSVFNTWKSEQVSTFKGRFEVRIQRDDHETIPVGVSIRRVEFRQRSFVIVYLREIGEERQRENQLRAKLQEQKARAVEAINSSLRVYLFNEKIRSTPVLTARLLNVESEQELFREAAKVMQSEDGLNYREVTFLTLSGGILNAAFSTRQLNVTQYPLGEENRYSRFLRRSGAVSESPEGEILLPLRSRGELMGVCEVHPYPREHYYLSESAKVGKWQHDMLLTLGDLIALLIDNLRLKKEIKRRSIMDTLTETYNRHYFVGRLSAEVSRSGRYDRPVSMLFLDVDNFKLVNDSHGHLFGDRVLRELAKLFVEHLRQTDVVCRYGGDEFVALLPETDEAMAREAAEKLIEAVGRHSWVNPENPDARLSISVSVGVNTLSAGENEEAFLKGADVALYEAKQSGRGCMRANYSSRSSSPSKSSASSSSSSSYSPSSSSPSS